MWLLVAFLAVPLIEIVLFISIGGMIGLWPTLLIVVLTALIGASMVKNQGVQTMNRIRSSFNGLKDPSEPLAHGAMILFAGALLLTPGFFTDAVGFALLVPAVRTFVFQFARSRVHVQGFSTSSHFDAQPDVVEAEYEELDPKSSGRSGSSGWTKH